MTNTKALRERIKLSGLKYSFIAEKMGITAYSLQKKINNICEFKVSEVEKLSAILQLSLVEKNDIFFALDVE